MSTWKFTWNPTQQILDNYKKPVFSASYLDKKHQAEGNEKEDPVSPAWHFSR
jgi:hypothetical protein